MANELRFTRSIVRLNYKQSECTYPGAFLFLYGKIVYD